MLAKVWGQERLCFVRVRMQFVFVTIFVVTESIFKYPLYSRLFIIVVAKTKNKKSKLFERVVCILTMKVGPFHILF